MAETDMVHFFSGYTALYCLVFYKSIADDVCFTDTWEYELTSCNCSCMPKPYSLPMYSPLQSGPIPSPSGVLSALNPVIPIFDAWRGVLNGPVVVY